MVYGVKRLGNTGRKAKIENRLNDSFYSAKVAKSV